MLHDAAMPLGAGLWLGEHPEAAVPFEGACLELRPIRGGLSVVGGPRTVLIRPGGTLRVELPNDSAVTIGAVEQRRMERERLFRGDIRLLVLTAAVVLLGLWSDTLQRWSTTHPEVVAELEALPSFFWAPRPEPSVQPQPERHHRVVGFGTEPAHHP